MNNKLNLTAQQVEFLEFYDPWGAKLYLTAKDNKDLTRNVFKLLEHRNPMYYRWFDGDWQEEHDANTYDYSEAEAYLTYSISPLNLSEVVIVGFLVVSVTAVAVEAIPALIAGVSKYGYSTALGLQSVGLLNEELPVLEEASEAELGNVSLLVTEDLAALGSVETQAEVTVIQEGIAADVNLAVRNYIVPAENTSGLYGFSNGITANQIRSINNTFGGNIELNGSVESALENSSRYNSFWEKTASITRSIVANHTFDNGNKRTALAVIQELMTRNNVSTGVNIAQMRQVIYNIATGQLTDIGQIAQALRGF